MLKIIGFTDKPCFMTGETGPDVVKISFVDKSFSGCLKWSELLKVMKRKTAENEKAKRDAEQASSTPTTKLS